MIKSLPGLLALLLFKSALLLSSGSAFAGSLKAYMFEDVVVVWKSQEDLERATDLIANESLEPGDLESLVACLASSGQEAEVISTLSDGFLLKVRVASEDCEGIVFAEEYKASP
jgi:hypothetical protein